MILHNKQTVCIKQTNKTLFTSQAEVFVGPGIPPYNDLFYQSICAISGK